MKWEYYIERLEMPSEWPIGGELNTKWDELRASHLEAMNRLGIKGWDYFMNIGPLFYFKRPLRTKSEDEIMKHFENRSSLV